MGTIFALILLLLLVAAVVGVAENKKENIKREQDLSQKYEPEMLARIKNHEVWSDMTLDQFTDSVPNVTQYKQDGELFYRVNREGSTAKFVFDDDYRLSKIIVQ